MNRWMCRLISRLSALSSCRFHGKKEYVKYSSPPCFYVDCMNKSGHFSIKDILFNRDQDPDHNAIECPGFHPLTYRDLRLQIRYVIKTLSTMGFHRNDRIAIITPAGPETAVIIISVMAGFSFPERVWTNHYTKVLSAALVDEFTA